MVQTAPSLFEIARQLGYETDADLARALGVSRSTISKIKSGERGMGLHFRRRVRRLFPRYQFPDDLEVTA